MDSTYHALSSLLVGTLGAIALGEPPSVGVGIVVFAVAVGVGIDFDHFLLARYNTGSWRALASLVRDPRLLVARDEIFAENEVGRIKRLLTHVLIAGGVVSALFVVWRALALVAAAVLYVHLLLDLVHDARAVAGSDT